MKAISLFTGVGGLDFGFEAAGFDTAVAIEIDRTCCEALRSNRDWPVIEDDIHAVTTERLLETASLKIAGVDVLIGGPPCQPFSKSGYWVTGDAKRLGDARADTLSAYLRVLEETQPRAFLLENVSGLAYRGKDEGLNRILGGIAAINQRTGSNYKPVWKVLNAASFGVPQLRERVFIVGSRDGTEFRFPDATHGEQGALLPNEQPYRTTWDAIGDLPDLPNDEALVAGGKWAKLLPTIPEGANYLWHTKRGGGLPLFGWRTRYWNFLLKLAKDRPSWTIQAQPGSATGPFHWSNRKLSARELARLQTFPDGLVFDASRNEIQRMLGNAVPSLLGEVLARAIAVQLLGRRRYGKPPRLMPPVRPDMPAPEFVQAVDRPYLALIDDHDDHPGTGLGRRAQLRTSKAA
ncbi:DNA cytosine methyltransferase [Sphingomonas sp. PWP1-2]|uniref:DNA cytosine methyltransferase n=2 Tax=Sphingomonas sp. PWP1-2 TaxID=2804558 RepID=UPI003CE9675D